MQKVSEVERLVKEISAKEKVLHVLVNNAGAAWGDKIDAYPVSTCSQMVVVLTGADN
jgi:NADP-dependent 3-hydroxy acid dehydrogenase YdfG